MYDIESLYEATSVADACRALAADPTAEVIAGGTDVRVKLREGPGAPAHLVSLHDLIMKDSRRIITCVYTVDGILHHGFS